MNKKFFALTLLLVAFSAQATKVVERESVVPGSITTNPAQNKVTIRGENHIKEVVLTQDLQLGADHARVEEIPGQNVTRTYVQKPDGTRVLVAEDVSERPLDVNETKVGSTSANSTTTLTSEAQAAAVAGVAGLQDGKSFSKDTAQLTIDNEDGTKTTIKAQNKNKTSVKTSGAFRSSFVNNVYNPTASFLYPTSLEGAVWYKDLSWYRRRACELAVLVALYKAGQYLLNKYAAPVVLEEEVVYEYDAYGNLVLDQYGNPVVVAVRK